MKNNLKDYANFGGQIKCIMGEVHWSGESSYLDRTRFSLEQNISLNTSLLAHICGLEKLFALKAQRQAQPIFFVERKREQEQDHGLTDAIFSGDFWVFFNSFCFGDYFKLKREVVWCARSLGHDDNLTWNKPLQARDCLIDATDV